MRRLILICTVLISASVSAQVRVLATGGKSPTSWHGQADLQGVSFELGRPISPRTTVAVAITPAVMWQPRSWFGDQYGDGNEKVPTIGASLLVRRAFRPTSPVQWYVEGGTGPMLAEKRVPASTSRFNFVTQGGAGVVLNANGRLPVIVGYRFLHISNGGYAPRNPGLNVSAAVLGLQLRSAVPFRNARQRRR